MDPISDLYYFPVSQIMIIDSVLAFKVLSFFIVMEIFNCNLLPSLQKILIGAISILNCLTVMYRFGVKTGNI